LNRIIPTYGTRLLFAASLGFATACSEPTEPVITNPNKVGSTGGTVVSSDSKVTLQVPAGAVSRDIVVSMTPSTTPNEHVIAGSVYEFGPDGTQFAQPVTLRMKYDDSAIPAGMAKGSLRVAKEVNGEWVEVETTVVDSTNRILSAQITSFSKYDIKANACVPRALSSGIVAGEITRRDCLYTTPHRRSDYYNFTVPAATAYSVLVSAPFTGVIGIKAYNDDPAAGLVWNSTNINTPMRVMLAPGRYQLFVSGQDTTKLGSYTINATTAAGLGNIACNEAVALTPGASNTATLSTQSCDITLANSVNPAFNGQKSRADYYAVKVEAGKSYEFTATITTPDTNIALAIWAGGRIVSVDGSLATTQTKRRTFNATVTGYIVLEVSASTMSPTVWTAPLGGYRVAVTGG